MPLLRPDDKPAIWLNEEIVTKYRPEMRRVLLRPDEVQDVSRPARIKYPTVREPAVAANTQ